MCSTKHKLYPHWRLARTLTIMQLLAEAWYEYFKLLNQVKDLQRRKNFDWGLGFVSYMLFKTLFLYSSNLKHSSYKKSYRFNSDLNIEQLWVHFRSMKLIGELSWIIWQAETQPETHAQLKIRLWNFWTVYLLWLCSFFSKTICLFKA